MSMHLIEDLVEGSIRVLHAAAPARDRGVRDRIAELYRFQSEFDCSLTYFRVMDILVERGFSHRLPLDAHPEYGHRRDFFDGLREFTALSEFGNAAGETSGEHPDEAYDEDSDDEYDEQYDESRWLDEGYVEPPHLYCDTGTGLWKQLVATGKLVGERAEPLRSVPLPEVVLEVARAAERAGDIELIALWHALGWHALLHPATFDDPRDIPALSEIRDIALRSGAASFDLPSGFRPTPGFFAEDELELWWLGES